MLPRALPRAALLASLTSASASACHIESMNFCGSPTGAVAGEADVLIGSTDQGGTVALGGTTALFGADAASATATSIVCDEQLTGQATDDGSTPLTFMVDCTLSGLPVHLTASIPDVRSLSATTVVALAFTGAADSAGDCPFTVSQGAATLTVVDAVGSKAPSPAFTTPDFLRSVLIDLVASGADLVPSAGASATCAVPASVTLHAHAAFRAGDYLQAYGGGCDLGAQIPAQYIPSK